MKQRTESLMMILLLSLSCTMILGDHLTYDLNAINSERFGYNPYEDSLLDLKNGQPKNREAIFDISTHIIPPRNSGCYEISTKIPIDYYTTCYSDESSFYQYVIQDIDDLQEFIFSAEDSNDYHTTPDKRYGGYNSMVLDLYSDVIEGKRIIITMYKKFIADIELASDDNGEYVFAKLSCGFAQAVANLDPSSGARYPEFIAKFGLYYKYEVNLGTMVMLVERFDPEDTLPTLDSSDQFNSALLNPENSQNVFFLGGNSYEMKAATTAEQRMNIYWDTYTTNMGMLEQEYLGKLSQLIEVHPEFDELPNRAQIVQNLENTINEFVNDVGILWLDRNIATQASNIDNYFITVVFEDGVTLSTNGPATLSHNGLQIVDIALTSRWVAYLKITHSNWVDDYEEGDFNDQIEFGGTQTKVDAQLSYVTGLRIVDTFGAHEDLQEIWFFVNGVKYDNTEFNSFPEGITNILIVDRSGW